MGKKFIFYVLMAILAIPALNSCDRFRKALPAGHYVFYGVIDDVDQIIMDINVERDGKITGTNRYKYSQNDDNKTYEVNGTVGEEGKITLNMSEKGETKIVQVFDLKAEKEKNKITMEGSVKDKKNDEKYDVELSTDMSIFKTAKGSSSRKKSNDDAPSDSKKDKKIVNNSSYPIAPGKYTFNGKAEGKYPIVVYLTVKDNGSISGKMAYKSTLKKYGDKDKNYMKLSGRFSGNSMNLDGTYDDGNTEDWDLNVSDDGKQYFLDGSAYNTKMGKTFSIRVSGN